MFQNDSIVATTSNSPCSISFAGSSKSDKQSSKGILRQLEIHFLTGECQQLTANVKACFHDILQFVCAQAKIEDIRLFGFAYKVDDEYLFVDLSQKISKFSAKARRRSLSIIERGAEQQLQLHLRIQLYVDFIRLIRDPTSLHHYFQQLRENVCRYWSSPAAVSEERIFEVAALALQAEFGDFNGDCHEPGYVQAERYFPSWVIAQRGLDYITRHMPAVHQDLTGLEPSEAAIRFCREVSGGAAPANCHRYAMRKQKSAAGENLFLGIGCSGLAVYEPDGENYTLATLAWPQIGKVAFERKRFSLASLEGRRFAFYCSSDEKAKYLFEFCRCVHQLAMGLHAEIIDACAKEQEETRSYREAYIYSNREEFEHMQQSAGGEQLFTYHMSSPFGTNHSSGQRVSVVSDVSSNTTSGIVSDRQHNHDDSEGDDFELPDSSPLLSELSISSSMNPGEEVFYVSRAQKTNSDPHLLSCNPHASGCYDNGFAFDRHVTGFGGSDGNLVNICTVSVCSDELDSASSPQAQRKISDATFSQAGSSCRGTGSGGPHSDRTVTAGSDDAQSVTTTATTMSKLDDLSADLASDELRHSRTVSSDLDQCSESATARNSYDLTRQDECPSVQDAELTIVHQLSALFQRNFSACSAELGSDPAQNSNNRTPETVFLTAPEHNRLSSSNVIIINADDNASSSSKIDCLPVDRNGLAGKHQTDHARPCQVSIAQIRERTLQGFDFAKPKISSANHLPVVAATISNEQCDTQSEVQPQPPRAMKSLATQTTGTYRFCSTPELKRSSMSRNLAKEDRMPIKSLQHHSSVQPPNHASSRGPYPTGFRPLEKPSGQNVPGGGLSAFKVCHPTPKRLIQPDYVRISTTIPAPEQISPPTKSAIAPPPCYDFATTSGWQQAPQAMKDDGQNWTNLPITGHFSGSLPAFQQGASESVRPPPNYDRFVQTIGDPQQAPFRPEPPKKRWTSVTHGIPEDVWSQIMPQDIVPQHPSTSDPAIAHHSASMSAIFNASNEFASPLNFSELSPQIYPPCYGAVNPSFPSIITTQMHPGNNLPNGYFGGKNATSLDNCSGVQQNFHPRATRPHPQIESQPNISPLYVKNANSRMYSNVLPSHYHINAQSQARFTGGWPVLMQRQPTQQHIPQAAFLNSGVSGSSVTVSRTQSMPEHAAIAQYHRQKVQEAHLAKLARLGSQANPQQNTSRSQDHENASLHSRSSLCASCSEIHPVEKLDLAEIKNLSEALNLPFIQALCHDKSLQPPSLRSRSNSGNPRLSAKKLSLDTFLNNCANSGCDLQSDSSQSRLRPVDSASENDLNSYAFSNNDSNRLYQQNTRTHEFGANSNSNHRESIVVQPPPYAIAANFQKAHNDPRYSGAAFDRQQQFSPEHAMTAGANGGYQFGASCGRFASSPNIFLDAIRQPPAYSACKSAK